MEHQGEGHCFGNISMKGTQFTFRQPAATYGNPVVLRGTGTPKFFAHKKIMQNKQVSGGQGLQEMWSKLVDVLWLHSFSPVWILK